MFLHRLLSTGYLLSNIFYSASLRLLAITTRFVLLLNSTFYHGWKARYVSHFLPSRYIYNLDFREIRSGWVHSLLSNTRPGILLYVSIYSLKECGLLQKELLFVP